MFRVILRLFLFFVFPRFEENCVLTISCCAPKSTFRFIISKPLSLDDFFSPFHSVALIGLEVFQPKTGFRITSQVEIHNSTSVCISFFVDSLQRAVQKARQDTGIISTPTIAPRNGEFWIVFAFRCFTFIVSVWVQNRNCVSVDERWSKMHINGIMDLLTFSRVAHRTMTKQKSVQHSPLINRYARRASPLAHDDKLNMQIPFGSGHTQHRPHDRWSINSNRQFFSPPARVQANESLINYAPVAANSVKCLCGIVSRVFRRQLIFFWMIQSWGNSLAKLSRTWKRKRRQRKKEKKVKMSVSGSETSRRAMEEEEKLVSGNR